jgi:Rv2525c-like, glycoside hydrolase-like domain
MLVCALGALAAASAEGASAQPLKVVQYAGYRVTVPARTPVYRLARHPRLCVRFDLAAVYLGHPGAAQSCPAHAAGRPRAVLIEPGRGVLRRPPAPRASVVPAATFRTNTRAAAASAVYTGLGFDVCSTPSLAQMEAWSASPYRAIGVYIGGANSACAQPNLNSAWISQQAINGWRLIPTYVGLQAPGACGCASISSSKATAEGTAAAEDAITQAQALGLGAGTPIYDDMEAYQHTSSNTAMVLKFLSAWTAGLHAAGYQSGVYSSSNSGITDLADQYGTSFVEPDDLWIANWNGTESTADPNVPSSDWPNHQRIHQYKGGHNETYGHVTLNVDNNYVDAATAGGAVTPAAAPTLTVSPTPAGTVELRARWPGENGVSAWQVLAGPSEAVTPFGTPVSGGSSTTINVHSQFPFYAVEALGSSGQVLGISTTAATPPHVVIYGRQAFVPSSGFGAVPIACYAPSGCAVTTTVRAGRTVLAQSAPEPVSAGAGRLAFFTLSAAGRKRLATAPARRLAVTVALSGSGFPTISANLALVPFTTTGRGPSRSLTDSPSLPLIGSTVFAYRGRSAALFAGCLGTTPCPVVATIRSGRTVVAQSATETLGIDAFGYIGFTLTPQGRALLLGSRKNQLGARVTLSDGTATTTGQIALVSYR